MTKLKKLRIERGLTQNDLARMSGLTQTRICALENTKGMIEGSSTYTIAMLASALDVKLWDLIDNDKYVIILKEVSQYPREMVHENGGSYLPSMRMQKKLSQLNLAKALGISQGAVSRWENEGVDSMRMTLLCGVCSILHCHPCDIINSLKGVI